MAKTLTGKPQTALLLDHFRVKPSITNLEAQALYRIRALPRRISDLEERGHVFQRSVRKDPTGQKYVRYFYRGYAEAALAA